MSEIEKPFVCVRNGINFKIAPRNAAGWRALGVWMLIFFAMLGGFLWLLDPTDSKGTKAATIAGFILGLALWSISMIRWMWARSEVIDVRELLDLKREQDRQRQRRHPPGQGQ